MVAVVGDPDPDPDPGAIASGLLAEPQNLPMKPMEINIQQYPTGKSSTFLGRSMKYGQKSPT